MKVNFSAIITNLDGTPAKDGDTDVTLGKIACGALLATYRDENEVSGEEKVRRFRLAEIAAKAGEQDVKVEDVALLKKLIAKAFPPLVVGRAYDIIEPPLA